MRCSSRPHAVRSVLLSLFLSSIFLGGCTSIEENSKSKNIAQGLAIVQGLTNDTATQIAILAPKSMKLSIKVTDVTKSTEPILIPHEILFHEIAESPQALRHVRLSGLALEKNYRLEVKDQYGRTVDVRQFNSLDTRPRRVKIATASCMSDLYVSDSAPMWKSVKDAKPELLVLLGDNVYAAVVGGVYKGPLDQVTLWNRYAETFLKLDFYRFEKLIPTIAVWDDFDFGMKDGGTSNPHRFTAKTVFDAFFPQGPGAEFPNYEKGPGTSARYSAFGFEFVLFDNRTFRTAETHFGTEQEEWFFNGLSKEKKPMWLVSGDQWFGGYHKFESYEGNHPKSFTVFLNRLSKSSRPAMFFSGDRHLSEVIKVEKELLGYETYEFTSSPLHAKTYPSNWDTIPNRRHVQGIAQKLNFNLVTVEAPEPSGKVQLTVEAIGAKSQSFFSLPVTVQPRSPSLRSKN
jgi:alkaline phosphatase D